MKYTNRKIYLTGILNIESKHIFVIQSKDIGLMQEICALGIEYKYDDASAYKYNRYYYTRQALKRDQIIRSYYWPKVYRDVNYYTINCSTCQRAQRSQYTPYGILQLLLVPEILLQDVLIDFIIGLPWFKGKNARLVIVCQLTKMRHLILY